MQIRPSFGMTFNRTAQATATTTSARSTDPAPAVQFGRDLTPQEQTIELTQVVDKLIHQLTPQEDLQQGFINKAMSKLQTAQITADYDAQRQILSDLIERGQNYLSSPPTGKITLNTQPRTLGEDGQNHVQVTLNGERFYVMLDDDLVVSIEQQNANNNTSTNGLVGWLRFVGGQLMQGSKHSTQILVSGDPALMAKAEHFRSKLGQAIKEQTK